MLFGSTLVVAVLALTGVLANPVAVEERTNHPQNHCEGGSYLWNGKCVCPPEKKEWDWDKHQCKKPCLPQPHCKKDEKPYCLKSKTQWCVWDKHRDECKDDHHNIVFCCKEKDLPDRIKDHYPDDHQHGHHCNDKEDYKWHPEHKKCECPHGKYWNEKLQKCKWKPLPKPHCPGHQKPRCGENRKKHCDYDDKNDYCRDDGHHKTFCCDDKDLKYWLNHLFHD